MSDKDGGSAFPTTSRFNDHGNMETLMAGGMSLRDYFAAVAMQAIIAKTPLQEVPKDWYLYEKTAIGAYDYADAMLAAREAK